MSEIKTSHYKIRSPLSRPWQPFSLVLLADLHNASFGPRNERLLQEIRAADPRAVLAAGDMVVAKGKRFQADAAVELLGELTRRYPVFYANGNHEDRLELKKETFGDAYQNYMEEIQSLGVRLLMNTSQQLEINRMKLAIYGYRPDWKYYRHGCREEMTERELTEALGEPDPDVFTILLAHHPSYFKAYARWGADLTLSGHLHGGMVRLPLLGGVVSPGWTLFPKYDHGLYTMGSKKMIVSAGLASHTIKLRLNNPPELVVIDFL